MLLKSVLLHPYWFVSLALFYVRLMALYSAYFWYCFVKMVFFFIIFIWRNVVLSCCIGWFHNINYVMKHDHINYLYSLSSHEMFSYEDGVRTLSHHFLARGLHQERHPT